jgi:hypothetical protein
VLCRKFLSNLSKVLRSSFHISSSVPPFACLISSMDKIDELLGKRSGLSDRDHVRHFLLRLSTKFIGRWEEVRKISKVICTVCASVWYDYFDIGRNSSFGCFLGSEVDCLMLSLCMGSYSFDLKGLPKCFWEDLVLEMSEHWVCSSFMNSLFN